jgi:hypothetical protein
VKRNTSIKEMEEDRSEGKEEFMIERKICFPEEVASTSQFLVAGGKTLKVLQKLKFEIYLLRWKTLNFLQIILF